MPRAEFVQEPVYAPEPARNDLVPLPPPQLGTGAEALAPVASEINPPASNDITLGPPAPFAEDIEIDETLSQQPAKRRELTGRDMLINVVEGEEIRIAVIRRSQLEELYMERSSTESHIGNIYKGRVTNVEPSIQAAFIDFGIGKNGFLHISDVHPQYFPKKMQPRMPQQHQRRNAPPPRPPTQAAPQGPQGFQPPPGAQMQQPSSQTEGGSQQEQAPLPQSANAESPGVSFDEQQPGAEPSHSAETNGGQTGSSGEAQQPFGEQEQSHPGVEAEAQTDSHDDAESTDDGDPAEAVNAKEAAIAEPEEPADFGSAYNSDFEEDDEYRDEDDEADLDDGHMKPMEKVGRKTPRRERPPIQQCLRRGQEVIVQVTKEGIGTKGPTLTTYVSCPGRYLVMMPGMAQLGVSRKIEDLDQRRELKRTLQELNPPKNLGFIIRTAGTDVAKKELQGDLNYLVRMWKVIANRIRTHKAPVELYQESDLVIRTIRDVFSDEIDRIIVDNEQVASRIRDFLSIVDPRAAGIVELYTGTMPLFQKFGVEREIEKINSRRVELNNGGSLVIDSTEALVAIDVNSGRYREQRDAELTAFNMNKEALKEVVRQLRLRDLGGVIVIDFIDMREERHKREIERLLRDELATDRAKTKVLRMSQFCMIELTRQRVRPSLKRSIYQDCPHCHGSALIKTPESLSLDVMRRLAAGTTRLDVTRIDVRAYPSVATFLLNHKRKALVDLEDKSNKRITVIPDDKLAGDQIVLEAHDARGSLLNVVL
jgi:ribonuclease E